MKAVLKSYYSVNIENLESYIPNNPESYGFNLTLLVGPKDSDGEESFNIIVVTPKWLLEKYANPAFAKDEIIIGRHYLIVFEYNFERIISFIRNYVENCTGDSWDEIAEKLARLGQWEFEDYREYQEPLMDIGDLHSLEKPRFHLLSCSEKELNDFSETVKADSGLFVSLIDGANCQAKSGLLQEMAKALKFPSYFGQNWDALDECLSDLAWLRARGYILFFSNADQILAKENEKNLLSFFDILETTIQYWSGEENNIDFQRPFHFVFQCDPKTIDSFRARLKRSKIVL